MLCYVYNYSYISTIISILFTSLPLIIYTLASVLLAGSLPMAERKFLALIQRRVGPNLVGYKGRMQFIADALKLLVKETIYINSINKSMLVILPTLYLVINLLFMFSITWGNNLSYFSFEYDLVSIALIMALSNKIIIYVGPVLKNKYTSISSTRAATVALNMDISMAFLINLLVIYTGSFNFNQIMKIKLSSYPITFLIIASVPMVFIMLMDLGRAPFDLVEAETELIMGFFSEYSGFLFVIFLLGEYLHIGILCHLINIYFL